MNKQSRILIAGGSGLAGSALRRRLEEKGFVDLLLPTHAELDLTRQQEVEAYFRSEQPEFVFLTAARVGGIRANSTYPAEFIYTNLAIEVAVLHAAYQAGVKRLIFFSSTCAYPRQSAQPMAEEKILTGELESTSESYAIAKLAGLQMCRAYNTQYGTRFLVVIPPTLYGPNDNFDPQTSHVVSGLIHRFHEAKCNHQSEVVLWGTGQARRELLYVDDLADACLNLMEQSDSQIDRLLAQTRGVINVGAGSDITILELAQTIRRVVGGDIRVGTDPSKPEGTFQKLLDSRRMAETGWTPAVQLADGIARTYQWYTANQPAGVAS
jgi:GDP-L-fucose synthase